jgi:hypothetical protein
MGRRLPSLIELPDLSGNCTKVSAGSGPKALNEVMLTTFADLDAPIRNDAAQEPVIVAPATRRTDRSLPSACVMQPVDGVDRTPLR